MVAGGSDSGPKDADMVAAVAKAWPMSEFTPYRSSLSWCFRLLSQLVIPCYFHMRGLFNCGQVKAVAREQHLEEEKKRCRSLSVREANRRIPQLLSHHLHNELQKR